MNRAKQCNDCLHFEFMWPKSAECLMGNKPRWYMPRNELDTNWGWKCRCEDFVAKEKPVACADVLTKYSIGRDYPAAEGRKAKRDEQT